jgi:hypothetical protein
MFEGHLGPRVNKANVILLCNFHIIFIEFMYENYQTIIRIDYKLIILQLFKLSRLY